MCRFSFFAGKLAPLLVPVKIAADILALTRIDCFSFLLLLFSCFLVHCGSDLFEPGFVFSHQMEHREEYLLEKT